MVCTGPGCRACGLDPHTCRKLGDGTYADGYGDGVLVALAVLRDEGVDTGRLERLRMLLGRVDVWKSSGQGTPPPV